MGTGIFRALLLPNTFLIRQEIQEFQSVVGQMRHGFIQGFSTAQSLQNQQPQRQAVGSTACATSFAHTGIKLLLGSQFQSLISAIAAQGGDLAVRMVDQMLARGEWLTWNSVQLPSAHPR
jgi:hypothetical protein